MYVMPAGGMFSTVHETDNDGLCATTYYSLFVFLLDTFHENGILRIKFLISVMLCDVVRGHFLIIFCNPLLTMEFKKWNGIGYSQYGLSYVLRIFHG